MRRLFALISSLILFAACDTVSSVIHNDEVVASLGKEYFKQGKPEPADDLIPIYLRKSQAEREREEKLAAEGQA